MAFSLTSPTESHKSNGSVSECDETLTFGSGFDGSTTADEGTLESTIGDSTFGGTAMKENQNPFGNIVSSMNSLFGLNCTTSNPFELKQLSIDSEDSSDGDTTQNETPASNLTDETDQDLNGVMDKLRLQKGMFTFESNFVLNSVDTHALSMFNSSCSVSSTDGSQSDSIGDSTVSSTPIPLERYKNIEKMAMDKLKKSTAAGKDDKIVPVERLVERHVDYDNDSARLYKAIDTKRWDKASELLKQYPDEAKNWVFRSGDPGKGYLWMFLPLHAACFSGAPLSLVKELVAANPQSVQMEAMGNKLPIHILCETTGNLKVIVHLLSVFPESLYAVDDKGSTPIQLAIFAQKSKNRSQIVRTLTTAAIDGQEMPKSNQKKSPIRGLLKKRSTSQNQYEKKTKTHETMYSA
jgi:hypothetical protein